MRARMTRGKRGTEKKRSPTRGPWVGGQMEKKPLTFLPTRGAKDRDTNILEKNREEEPCLSITDTSSLEPEATHHQGMR
ncbi:unnamed protein product [Nezara viridula]|uniref:Uncharacterized protein n=1 Tax=Nezara viridula TaxID=85310 RepID=A0A9P0GYD4_NEZVI|nr:unnamed protein product [Nezara viridula]